MLKESLARQRFRAIIRQPEAQLNLAEAVLCIAWEDQAEDDPRAVLQQLDLLAEMVRPRLEGITAPDEQVAILNAWLFGELGFRGNVRDYGNPVNSYFDRVMERRSGLPIILSLIYVEVSQRLGLPVFGLALPGHFLVRYSSAEREIIIDPFERGRLWSRAECERRVRAVYGVQADAVMEQVMAPPSARAVLVRVLRNLKNAYIERADLQRAHLAIERILLLEPDDLHEIRDRGILRLRLGQFHRALDDLERYAAAFPSANDLPVLRQQAHLLTDPLVPMN